MKKIEMSDCQNCFRSQGCIHCNTYRRLPVEKGGLGECPNLKACKEVWKQFFYLAKRKDNLVKTGLVKARDAATAYEEVIRRLVQYIDEQDLDVNIEELDDNTLMIAYSISSNWIK